MVHTDLFKSKSNLLCADGAITPRSRREAPCRTFSPVRRPCPHDAGVARAFRGTGQRRPRPAGGPARPRAGGLCRSGTWRSRRHPRATGYPQTDADAEARAPDLRAFEHSARAAGDDEAPWRHDATGSVADAHSHRFEVDALAVDDEMRFMQGGQTRRLRPGDRLRVDVGQPRAERYGPKGARSWFARRHARGGRGRCIGPQRADRPRIPLRRARRSQRCPGRRRCTSSPTRTDPRCAAIRKSPWWPGTPRSNQSDAPAQWHRRWG